MDMPAFMEIVALSRIPLRRVHCGSDRGARTLLQISLHWARGQAQPEEDPKFYVVSSNSRLEHKLLGGIRFLDLSFVGDPVSWDILLRADSQRSSSSRASLGLISGTSYLLAPTLLGALLRRQIVLGSFLWYRKPRGLAI
ncbi:hypothetical protein L6164_006181 [Bauhinia variegata]|uniref:Uncharacterized protein n=1 Tax=Bauhinia variegata TaxID=167791 RepID=A0ACB9PZ16_BAUVA|nr:hypothetical protein L6164_006181 [Bauhinia variegata]